MKILTRYQLKDIKGGNFIPPGGEECSTGQCGPENAYSCTIEYVNEEETSPAVCCCSHGNYNHQCEV